VIPTPKAPRIVSVTATGKKDDSKTSNKLATTLPEEPLPVDPKRRLRNPESVRVVVPPLVASPAAAMTLPR
jgi:hypothetical protein